MKTSELDRIINDLHRYNRAANAVATAADAAPSSRLAMPLTALELSRVLRRKLARGSYPFTPGSRPFRLLPSRGDA